MEYNIFLIKNQIMRGKYEHFLVKSVFHGDFPDFFRRKKLPYKIVYILNSTKTHYGVRPTAAVPPHSTPFGSITPFKMPVSISVSPAIFNAVSSFVPEYFSIIDLLPLALPESGMHQIA